jgi:hypothetical protein
MHRALARNEADHRSQSSRFVMTTAQVSSDIYWQRMQQFYVCSVVQTWKMNHRLAYTCSNSVTQAKLHEATLALQLCGSLDVAGISLSENRFAQIGAAGRDDRQLSA